MCCCLALVCHFPAAKQAVASPCVVLNLCIDETLCCLLLPCPCLPLPCSQTHRCITVCHLEPVHWHGTVLSAAALRSCATPLQPNKLLRQLVSSQNCTSTRCCVVCCAMPSWPLPLQTQHKQFRTLCLAGCCGYKLLYDNTRQESQMPWGVTLNPSPLLCVRTASSIAVGMSSSIAVQGRKHNCKCTRNHRRTVVHSSAETQLSVLSSYHRVSVSAAAYASSVDQKHYTAWSTLAQHSQHGCSTLTWM